MAISAAKRARVYARDRFICQYCGNCPDLSELTIDHVISKISGGRNGDDNLKTCCRTCNITKGKRPIEWLRKHFSIASSKYAGLMSVQQWDALVNAGAEFGEIHRYVFWFERMEAGK
jgi:hypothetical protein